MFIKLTSARLLADRRGPDGPGASRLRRHKDLPLLVKLVISSIFVSEQAQSGKGLRVTIVVGTFHIVKY